MSQPSWKVSVLITIIAVVAFETSFGNSHGDMSAQRHEVLTAENPTSFFPDSPSVERTDAKVKIRAEGWEAISSDVYGVGNCSLGSTVDDQKILISMVEGSRNDLLLSLQKTSWDIPDNKQIDLRIMMDGQRLSPITGNAYRAATSHSDAVSATVSGREAVLFLSLFKSRRLMTIRFGDPFEPSWAMPLAGSSKALIDFAVCMSRWQRMSK